MAEKDKPKSPPPKAQNEPSGPTKPVPPQSRLVKGTKDVSSEKNLTTGKDKNKK